MKFMKTKAANSHASSLKKAYWREHLASREKPLVLHSDSPMKAATLLEKLYDLGITSSNSRPRVSNDNAYSESLFKTLKSQPMFPVNGFKAIRNARDWVLKFVRWYGTCQPLLSQLVTN